MSEDGSVDESPNGSTSATDQDEASTAGMEGGRATLRQSTAREVNAHEVQVVQGAAGA